MHGQQISSKTYGYFGDALSGEINDFETGEGIPDGTWNIINKILVKLNRPADTNHTHTFYSLGS